MPANQVSLWADIEGEIRPAGRNHYNVWTPNALKNFLNQKNARFNGNIISIPIKELGIRKARGGNGKVSGYKINPLFFIYKEDCREENSIISFDIYKVRQLNPTIAGKMFFKKLKYQAVKNYYL